MRSILKQIKALTLTGDARLDGMNVVVGLAGVVAAAYCLCAAAALL